MVAIYKPRKPRQRVGYDRRRRIGLSRFIPDAPFAEPVLLDRELDTHITVEQIKQLVNFGYLHSTIVGFNADYKEYCHEVNISNLGEKYRQQGKQDLLNALDVLQHRADQMTDTIWGKDVVPNLSPTTTKNGIPTLDHLVRAQYLLKQSPVGLLTTEWISAYEQWQQAKGHYDRVISQHIEQDAQLRSNLISPAAKRVALAAQSLMNHISNFKNIISAEVPLDDGEHRDVTAVFNKIMAFDPMTDSVNGMNKQLVKLASYFGLRTETSRSATLLDQINNIQDISSNLQTGKITLQRVKTTGLSDIVFELETTVPKAPEPKSITAGISYKITTFDNFRMSATFSLPDEADDDLKYLFFVYNNILALTEFASDKLVGRTSTNKRVLVSNRAKKNNLALTLGTAKKSLVDFNVYITYRLLLTALFGNYQDASQSNPLDLHFFEDLEKGYNEAHTAPPVFLVTGKHVYKTADILKHYLNLDQRSSEWKNLNSFQQNFAGYHSYKDLHALWDRKKEILEAASAENIGQNVYNIFIVHKDDLGIADAKFKVGKLSFYREHIIKL